MCSTRASAGATDTSVPVSGSIAFLLVDNGIPPPESVGGPPLGWGHRTSTVHDDLELRDLAPAEVLAAVATARRAADRAEARLLALAVHWVDLHPITDHPPVRSRPRSQPWVRSRARGPAPGTALGGDGTPGIAEHALEALAATLDLSHTATVRLVGEAVELCFRLPRLWALVHDGRLQAWKARRVAHQTTTLSRAAVDFVDRHLAVDRHPQPHPDSRPSSTSWSTRPLLPLRPRPGRTASSRPPWTPAASGSTTAPSTATTDLTARLDTLDALDLQATIGDLAGILARLGDTRPLDLRQATALGPARPPATHPRPRPPRPPRTTRTTAPAGTEPHRRGHDRRRRTERVAGHPVPARHHRRPRPDQRRGGGGGRGRWRGSGRPPSALLRDWLARTSRVTVRPVLDLARSDAVDAHDPPGWMREAVVQRDGHCVFPGCPIDARSCDLDHLAPLRPTRRRRPTGPDHTGEPG